MYIERVNNDTLMRTNFPVMRPVLSRADRQYLKKTTSFVDSIWIYFTQIEEDFRLLNMPLK